MKAIYAILAMTILMLSACSAPVVEEVAEEAEDVEGIEVIEESPGKAEVEISTDEGDVTVEYEGENTDEWCQAGSKWSMTGAEGQAEMVIVGLETAGKYAGYCHVTYDVDMEGAQGNMDFYFNEEGAGYQVMDINGQKMETEWTP